MRTPNDSPPGPTTGLLTDRYELTMLDSWVANGHASNRAVFEAFARDLPDGRRYGLVAGLGRLVELIERFRFDPGEVDWLMTSGVINAATADYLGAFRFTGDVDAYPEGELYFPGSPVLTVTGSLGECAILETLVLSVLNHDTAIASAAARMVTAARGRPLMEMGSRRTHEESAVAVARAAYVAGFESTSNLAAGRRYNIPTIGTAAHSFMLSHASEEDAFRSQVEAQGPGTTLLVDTYDIAEGIRTAVRVAGPGLGAIRIDSGDLAEEALRARALLDELGAFSTRIVVTSDLEEHLVDRLAQAPVDAYGVGSHVADGAGQPSAGLVYKLVAIADSPFDSDLRPVAKKSAAKVSVGGRKTVRREYADGVLLAEHYAVGHPDGPSAGGVQVPVIRGGESVPDPTLPEVRNRATRALASLPGEARDLTDGPAYLTAQPEGDQS